MHKYHDNDAQLPRIDTYRHIIFTRVRVLIFHMISTCWTFEQNRNHIFTSAGHHHQQQQHFFRMMLIIIVSAAFSQYTMHFLPLGVKKKKKIKI